MRSIQSVLISFLLLFGLATSSSSGQGSPASGDLKLKAKQALAFCISKGYNTNFCIVIDLGIHSGLKRFFVWDFKNNAVTQSALVSHGCGNMPWSWTWSKEKAVLSNKDGSHCSAGGKYRVGKRGYSNWGINVNYKLYGLDKTNSNALGRQIVLHSWEKVPDEEVFPGGTPEGWGCPAISNNALITLDPKLRKSKLPVLLWIYQ